MESLTPILQTYSILAATLAAGANLSTTIISLPAFLHADANTLATQWQILYDSGIAPVVSMALSSSVGFATLAYRTGPGLTQTGLVSCAKRNLYIAAAVAAFGLAPYTQILMLSTNKDIMRRARVVAKKEESRAGDKEGTHAVVRRWGALNLGRGLLLLGAAGMGAWATVNY
ncbi:hypothetical protein B0J11DRAFT_146096 [Dendryphion nanum]|uniref:DUF1772-domain-containing protein n=1 Tax=Dendryphion nanum TaxID=256645 RepID=A0A9P9D5S5_9PLEO|nr:hypothetical protein B0J11DRAFT_146096 [Dendryphion nanum]